MKKEVKDAKKLYKLEMSKKDNTIQLETRESIAINDEINLLRQEKELLERATIPNEVEIKNLNVSISLLKEKKSEILKNAKIENHTKKAEPKNLNFSISLLREKKSEILKNAKIENHTKKTDIEKKAEPKKADIEKKDFANEINEINFINTKIENLNFEFTTAKNENVENSIVEQIESLTTERNEIINSNETLISKFKSFLQPAKKAQKSEITKKEKITKEKIVTEKKQRNYESKLFRELNEGDEFFQYSDTKLTSKNKLIAKTIIDGNIENAVIFQYFNEKYQSSHQFTVSDKKRLNGFILIPA